MKLIKFTSLLLCFVFAVVVFSGCNNAYSEKNQVSENSTESSEPAAVSEGEEIEKLEAWGTEYDWDFLKKWPVHSDCFPEVWSNQTNFAHYGHLTGHILVQHSYEVTKCETLLHVQIEFYYYNGEAPSPDLPDQLERCDSDEIISWLAAGNIPLEKNGATVFEGYVSSDDVEKLIEYGKAAGYYLYVTVPIDYDAKTEDGMFVCPHCNRDDENS